MKGIAAVLLLCLAGCASTPAQLATSSKVTPTTAEQAARCTYLDDVMGTSGRYGVFASSGIENARAEALKKAENIGATHVVWKEAATQYGSTSTQARAYRCP